MSSTEKALRSIAALRNIPPARQCQWPFGDPGSEDFHFCLKKTHPGFSYCKEHAARAYRQPEPRRRVA